ncbi:hypothetical protein DYB35_008717 [Aphanomyces astaci]|uniref:Uncharacterized protein n=1 Tax=Aphanomyces astaci TaxID=112090 RepID=A0A3R7ATM2_APHAT|nr:hypothetical protein DYB35_008717 [Aphanomyces astaci]
MAVSVVQAALTTDVFVTICSFQPGVREDILLAHLWPDDVEDQCATVFFEGFCVELTSALTPWLSANGLHRMPELFIAIPTLPRAVLVYAVYNDRVDIMTFLVQDQNLLTDLFASCGVLLNVALAGGHVSMVRYLRQAGYNPPSRTSVIKTATHALRLDVLDALDYKVEATKVFQSDPWFYDVAISQGRRDVFAYFAGTMDTSILGNVMSLAASVGHLDLAKFLHSHVTMSELSPRKSCALTCLQNALEEACFDEFVWLWGVWAPFLSAKDKESCLAKAWKCWINWDVMACIASRMQEDGNLRGIQSCLLTYEWQFGSSYDEEMVPMLEFVDKWGGDHLEARFGALENTVAHAPSALVLHLLAKWLPPMTPAARRQANYDCLRAAVSRMDCCLEVVQWLVPFVNPALVPRVFLQSPIVKHACERDDIDTVRFVDSFSGLKLSSTFAIAVESRALSVLAYVVAKDEFAVAKQVLEQAFHADWTDGFLLLFRRWVALPSTTNLDIERVVRQHGRGGVMTPTLLLGIVHTISKHPTLNLPHFIHTNNLHFRQALLHHEMWTGSSDAFKELLHVWLSGGATTFPLSKDQHAVLTECVVKALVDRSHDHLCLIIAANRGHAREEWVALATRLHGGYTELFNVLYFAWLPQCTDMMRTQRVQHEWLAQALATGGGGVVDTITRSGFYYASPRVLQAPVHQPWTGPVRPALLIPLKREHDEFAAATGRKRGRQRFGDSKNGKDN